MSEFSLRAIEVHSFYAWDFRWIAKVLDFAAKRGLNALVLHRNDIVDRAVYPGRLYGIDAGGARNVFERYNAAFKAIYRYAPTRRSGTILRRDYLRRVVEAARRRGLDVYLQNKELYFPDFLLERNPGLVKDGRVCPSEPFWQDYLRQKYTELLEDVPDIAGVITSLGTGESRLSITSNRCSCEACRTMTSQRWYAGLLGAMHAELARHGKRLAVRDFVFDRKSQDGLSAAMASLPADVALSIKNTPHDYFPTFPDNPLIRQARGREKWIEFDAMGQYFGWGIGPATMIEDLRSRLTSVAGQGASGVILRTDWESLDGHTAFDTLNVVNLYAGAALARNPATPAENIYTEWLEEAGAFRPGAGAGERTEAVEWLGSIFENNWPVVRQALFVRDCVFNDCSTFPVGLEQAGWLGEEKNSLKDWLPEAAGRFDATPENTLRILAEKDAAWSLVRELRKKVEQDGAAGLAPVFMAGLRESYRIFEHYVRGFRALSVLFALTRLGIKSGTSDFDLDGQPLSRRFAEAAAEIEAVIELYEKLYLETDHPPAVYQLLNAERLGCFRDDALARWKNK